MNAPEFEQEMADFATAVGLIVALEQGNRISILDAYRRIKRLWKSLKALKKELDDGQNPLSPNG